MLSTAPNSNSIRRSDMNPDGSSPANTAVLAPNVDPDTASRNTVPRSMVSNLAAIMCRSNDTCDAIPPRPARPDSSPMSGISPYARTTSLTWRTSVISLCRVRSPTFHTHAMEPLIRALGR